MPALINTWRDESRGDGSVRLAPSSSAVTDGERPMAELSVRQGPPSGLRSSLPSTTGVERTEPKRSTWSDVCAAGATAVTAVSAVAAKRRRRR